MISGSCVHHDGFVFDNEAADFEIYTPSAAVRISRELDHKALKSPNRRDEFQQQKNKFQWICCDTTFTNIRTNGCKHGKHESFPHGNDSVSRQMNKGKTNQLNQMAIEQWEKTCLNHQEYNLKWLSLAKEY